MGNRKRRAEDFAKPPKGYGIVPFYWWLGDKLTKERIDWQLEKMREHSVSGLQVNYAHGYMGGNSFGLTLPSDPPLFSEEWWELFKWFCGRGKDEGFSVSLSDYTLGSPGQGWYTDEILAQHPDMAGWLLEEKIIDMRTGESEKIEFPDHLLSIHTIKDGAIQRIDEKTAEHMLSFGGTEEGTVALVYARKQPFSINPMHPQIGKEVCRHFFQKFEEHLPGEAGKGLNFFFSDELNFGISGKLWDDDFAKEFYRRKGYDICDYLPCLFGEYEDCFAKIRLDYYDVIVAREEENYFKVIYEWHEKRNMTYGCDHGGRGYDLTEFGDYFRTQKYNQGPGCDQPNLASDIIKNKVASSIAHLYGRKRTWLEGFYGSGWGTSSGEFMDAVARNFVMGHNLLSVHGMYYSTHGGWWEWAPPCNTYHMPYWDDMGPALKAVERMSYLLSEGTHRCDVAVLYPVMAMEGGIAADRAIQTAFQSVVDLYENGIDVDFIDFQSILDGNIRDGRLEKEGESYRVLILPEMKTVRLAMMKKLNEFCARGGIVFGIGEAPSYCDSWEKEELGNSIGRISFGIDEKEIADRVRAVIPADVIFPAGEKGRKKYMLHRLIDGEDFYMIYGGEQGDLYGFRSDGAAVFWNPWDGKRYMLPSQRKNGYTYVSLPVSGRDLHLISFSQMKDELPVWQGNQGHRKEIALSTEWNFRLLPCLDNRFGDYSLPASDEMIGAQVRSLHYLCSDVEMPEKLSGSKNTCRCGFGPFYRKKGPFATRESYLACIRDVLAGDEDGFAPYEFSLRYGKWEDPGIQGYHGLKAQVSDEFMTMGKARQTLLGIEYIPEEEGEGYVFLTHILCESDCRANILCGSIKPEYLFLDGECVRDLNEKISLSRGAHHVIACYNRVGRTYLMFSQGKLEEKKYPLSMTWYGQKNILPLDGLYKTEKTRYEWFWFDAPPALEKMEIDSYGEVSVWIDGLPAAQDGGIRPKDRGITKKVIRSKRIPEKPCKVFIRAERKEIYHLGANFPEPIRLYCGEGKMNAGDWGENEGLAFYSGKAVYGQSFDMKEEELGQKAVLEIDDLSSSAVVFVNGKQAGTRVSAPWQFDITPFVQKGKNEIEVCVSNTLTNHYRSIPSRYCGNGKSGILGESRILIYKQA